MLENKSNNKAKVAGIVVLYNPPLDLIENISSYFYQVDYLYIVDNSNYNTEYLRALDKNKYKFIKNDKNRGIAQALNIGLELATIENYDFLLTMDQDSQLSEGFITNMLAEMVKNEKIGIISPFLVHNANPKKPMNNGCEKVIVTINSGSMVRLAACKKVGKYIDDLFIDYVDIEYCLRMHVNGFDVMSNNNALLYHNLGDITKRSLLFRSVFITNHSPLRYYYRTRNRFFVYQKYRNQFRSYIRNDLFAFLKEMIKIVLFENKKIQKIKMIIVGYLDYRKGKYGQYEI